MASPFSNNNTPSPYNGCDETCPPQDPCAPKETCCPKPVNPCCPNNCCNDPCCCNGIEFPGIESVNPNTDPSESVSPGCDSTNGLFYDKLVKPFVIPAHDNSGNMFVCNEDRWVVGMWLKVGGTILRITGIQSQQLTVYNGCLGGAKIVPNIESDEAGEVFETGSIILPTEEPECEVEDTGGEELCIDDLTEGGSTDEVCLAAWLQTCFDDCADTIKKYCIRVVNSIKVCNNTFRFTDLPVATGGQEDFLDEDGVQQTGDVDFVGISPSGKLKRLQEGLYNVIYSMANGQVLTKCGGAYAVQPLGSQFLRVDNETLPVLPLSGNSNNVLNPTIPAEITSKATHALIDVTYTLNTGTAELNFGDAAQVLRFGVSERATGYVKLDGNNEIPWATTGAAGGYDAIASITVTGYLFDIC